MFGNNRGGEYVDDTLSPLWGNENELGAAVNACLSRVFLRMFIALVVTSVTAFAVSTSEAILSFILSEIWVFYVIIIAQLAFVFVLSFAINKMSIAVANVLFFTYALLMGLTLSLIFLVYEIGLIYQAFGISALMFSVMALFGVLTRRDLSSLGSFCFMGLIGVIIASLVNFFLQSEMLDYIISYIAIFVFLGLTAYDTFRIKKMLRSANEAGQTQAIARISVIGALWLYLDFINLFLRVLRIMGRRR